MLETLNVSKEDIFYHIKISCQIPNLLEGIATRKIIVDAANQAGIQVTKKELQEAADNLRLINKLVKAEDTWAWLQKYHLSVDDFEQLAHTNLLSNKLAMHLFADKVEPFFYQHRIDYAGAAIYEVILDDEDIAWEIFYALQEGEICFQEIARQYIKEPELRRAGGYKGIQSSANLRPEIAAAVFAITPPQIIKPIMTPKGVHLIWVEEIIQPELNEQLRVKILGDLFADWLKQQIAELKIATQLENGNSQIEVAQPKPANVT